MEPHRLKQVLSYSGEHHNYELNQKYFTVLADWECECCNLAIKGHPDGLGKPELPPTCKKTKVRSHGT